MKFGFIFLVSILVLSLGVVSAVAVGTTTIAGAITYGDSGNDAVGAFVNVTCNGFSNDGIADASGDYAIDFSILECNESHTYSILASEGVYSGNDDNRAINRFLPGDLVVIGDLEIEEIIGNTTISGTIYNTTNESVVDGANVTVTCNSNIIETSSVNGTYSVNFLETVCNNSHSYTVFAEKGEYNGTSDENVSDVIITKTIVKEVIVVQSSSGGRGRSSVVMVCGNWSECINNITTQICNDGDITTTRACVSEVEEVVEKLPVSEVEVKDADAESLSAGLLFGNVIGGGATTWGIAIAFILAILGVFGYTRYKKNRI